MTSDIMCLAVAHLCRVQCDIYIYIYLWNEIKYNYSRFPCAWHIYSLYVLHHVCYGICTCEHVCRKESPPSSPFPCVTEIFSQKKKHDPDHSPSVAASSVMVPGFEGDYVLVSSPSPSPSPTGCGRLASKDKYINSYCDTCISSLMCLSL